MENLVLGRKVLHQVTAHPETLDMGTWGMREYSFLQRYRQQTACLAGHTLLQSGYVLRASNRYESPRGTIVRGRDIGLAAQDLLGLTQAEAGEDVYSPRSGIYLERIISPALFHMSNEQALARFRKIVEEEEARRAQSPSLAGVISPLWKRLLRTAPH